MEQELYNCKGVTVTTDINRSPCRDGPGKGPRKLMLQRNMTHAGWRGKRRASKGRPKTLPQETPSARPSGHRPERRPGPAIEKDPRGKYQKEDNFFFSNKTRAQLTPCVNVRCERGNTCCNADKLFQFSGEGRSGHRNTPIVQTETPTTVPTENPKHRTGPKHNTNIRYTMYCQAPSEAGTVAHESTEKIRNANRHINLRTNVVPQQDPLLHLRDIFRVRQI